MTYFIALLILFLIFSFLIVLFGVGIGFLLSKLISGVGIGMGIIAGAIFSIGSIDFFLRYISSIMKDKDDQLIEKVNSEIEEPVIVIPKKFWKNSKSNRKKKASKQ